MTTHTGKIGASPTISELIPSWELHLRAERKAAKTIITYTQAADQLADFLDAAGMPTGIADSDIAYDVHVRRVFLRTGLVTTTSSTRDPSTLAEGSHASTY